MTDQPLRLSDDQLTMLMRAASPLSPEDRTDFIEAVAAALKDKVIGDGVLYRVIAEQQRDFLDPPLTTRETQVPKWARR